MPARESDLVETFRRHCGLKRAPSRAAGVDIPSLSPNSAFVNHM